MNKDGEENKNLNFILPDRFLPLNYTGNVAAKHLKVACGPTGFCGTKFENHWAVAYRGGVWGVQPPPEIPKALQNRPKLNPVVKT